MRALSSSLAARKTRVRDARQPTIPFQRVHIEKFQASASFDYALVCQSPGFTPKSADALIQVMARYIVFDSGSAPLPER
jgi:hypothetical protein